MPLPKKYESLRGLFDRLVRQAGYLEQEVTWDEFNDFALTAFHLCEWVINDPRATPMIVAEAHMLKDTPELQACRDTSNRIKHRIITRYTPKTKDTEVNQGYGVGRYGKGGYGIGEEQVIILIKDGTEFDGLALTRAVAKLWQSFFAKYPQLLMG